MLCLFFVIFKEGLVKGFVAFAVVVGQDLQIKFGHFHLISVIIFAVKVGAVHTVAKRIRSHFATVVLGLLLLGVIQMLLRDVPESCLWVVGSCVADGWV